jgi:uncharacterized protein YjbI with pentapeptide repeats
VIEKTISESELLARYVRGERQFLGLDINGDGTNALQGNCLDGIELIGCFVQVSFCGASLRAAVIHSNVKTCDFSSTDLTGANFQNSALCATTFKNAKLDKADFTGAFFHSYILSRGERPNW